MSTVKKVVVIGGGITGLTAAYRLKQAAEKGAPVEPLLLEGSSRLGGKITTERAGGFVLEEGPDAFITVKPDALALAKELGLGPRLLPTASGRQDVYVYTRGRLRALPEGLLLMAPSKILPFLASDIVTWKAKLRMGLDLILPRGGNDKCDETLGDFTRRRLGQEALDTIVAPVMAGIYGGDANKLSLKSTFPRFIELERQYRSVIHGMRTTTGKRPKSNSGVTTFMSFETGLAEIVETLAKRLAETTRLEARIQEIKKPGKNWSLTLAGGEIVSADAVILTSTAWQAADLLGAFDEALARQLRDIPFTSTATLSLAYAEPLSPGFPPGFGFVVPSAEPGCVSAGTFTSSKFPSRSAPGKALVRLFLGGAGREETLVVQDAQLIASARKDLERMVGIRAEPELTRLRRWPKANPQYYAGHAGRLRAIEESLSRHPGLYLAGASYNGIGIPDCIASGHQSARRILENIV